MAAGKNASRHCARETAFQILYGLSFAQAVDLSQVRKAFLLSPHNAAKAESTADEPQGFAWELVKGVWQNRERLDAAISEYSQHWRVSRIGRIELTLLRLAAFELLFREDVPPKVVINEALELTSRFGEENAKKFINGILDAMNRALEWRGNDRAAKNPTPLTSFDNG